MSFSGAIKALHLKNPYIILVQTPGTIDQVGLHYSPSTIDQVSPIEYWSTFMDMWLLLPREIECT